MYMWPSLHFGMHETYELHFTTSRGSRSQIRVHVPCCNVIVIQLHYLSVYEMQLVSTMQAPCMHHWPRVADLGSTLLVPKLSAIACRMSSRFSEHTFQMMRAVTTDSTKVSAMQAVHIIRNNLLQYLLEAEGTALMPAMTSKRGATATILAHTVLCIIAPIQPCTADNFCAMPCGLFRLAKVGQGCMSLGKFIYRAEIQKGLGWSLYLVSDSCPNPHDLVVTSSCILLHIVGLWTFFCFVNANKALTSFMLCYQLGHMQGHQRIGAGSKVGTNAHRATCILMTTRS